MTLNLPTECGVAATPPTFGVVVGVTQSALILKKLLTFGKDAVYFFLIAGAVQESYAYLGGARCCW